MSIPDDALAGIRAYEAVAQERNEANMSIRAAEHCQRMTEAQLQITHMAAWALARLAGSILAQRRRG